MLVVGLDPNNSSDWTGAERTDPPQAAVSAPGLTLNDIWDSIVFRRGGSRVRGERDTLTGRGVRAGHP